MKNCLLFRIIIGTVLALAVSGCTSPQQQRWNEIKAAADQINAARADCYQRYENGELKTHVALAKCSNEATMKIVYQSNYPNPDLISRRSAEALRMAEKLDKHQITEGEAQTHMAELDIELGNIARQRDATQIQLQNQSTVANAAQQQVDQQKWQNLTQQGLQMMQRPPAPAPAPILQPPSHCYVNGPVVPGASVSCQ